jgi:hypothetical protein
VLFVAERVSSQLRVGIRAPRSLKAIQEHEVSQQTCRAGRKAWVDSPLASGRSDPCAADPLYDPWLHVSAAIKGENASS